MWEYTDKVKEHFLNPRNVGELDAPDGEAMVGSIACGDALKLTFKLDENEKIKEAKFQTFGCASAIATASARPSRAACSRCSVEPMPPLAMTGTETVEDTARISATSKPLRVPS